MSKWDDYSNEQKGRFIRYYFTNFQKLNREKTKDGFSGMGIKIKGNEYPSQVEMGTLRSAIFDNPKYGSKYLDFLGFGFKDTLTNAEIGDTFGQSYLLTPNEEYIDKYIDRLDNDVDARESGIAAKQIKNEAETRAITEPVEFLKDKAAKEKEIDRQALDVYKKSLDIYTYNYQYSKEKAQRKAKEDMETYRNGLIKKLNLLYGKENIAKAEKHIIKV